MDYQDIMLQIHTLSLWTIIVITHCLQVHLCHKTMLKYSLELKIECGPYTASFYLFSVFSGNRITFRGWKEAGIGSFYGPIFAIREIVIS